MAHPAQSWAGQSRPGRGWRADQVADLVVTNNTGPAHTPRPSDAGGRPLRLTNPPEQWRPWRVPQRLLTGGALPLCYQRICSYDHACLDVSPAQVAEAAASLLHEVQTPARVVAAGP